ncbi:hypothetical protein CC78DRAFT_281824 [Lojkania enalia]|uniref:BZIP domain-containing protein n=1 Tax=Lojkania enalia TaxID=147567 RepID=A0A9P4NAB4_9PLEO|nr:hypothetical protein CC78DRAFT_281824 [Didymosphaeria enalia]
MPRDVPSSSHHFASPSPSGDSNATTVQTPSPTSPAPPPPVSRQPGSRVITPAPAPASAIPNTTITPRLSLATASSPSGSYANPSPGGGGPTSASYVVPPRPKPGRKPATDEPASKRKAQNRESQRAFRARKAAKLTEMQNQVETAEQLHKQAINEKIAELTSAEERIKQLEMLLAQTQESERRAQQECAYWKDQCRESSTQYNTIRRTREPEIDNCAQSDSIRHRDLETQNWQPRQLPQMDFFHPRFAAYRQDSPTRRSLANINPLATNPQEFDSPKPVNLECGDCQVTEDCACVQQLAKLPDPNFFMATVPAVFPPPHTANSPLKGIQSSTDIFAEREIDFTAQFSKQRAKPETRTSIAFMTEQSEADSKCGFCTDESNCLCRDESLRQLQETEGSNEREVDGVASIERKPVEHGFAAPGSCDDCMANPLQRAWCQRVAQLKNSSSDLPTPSPSSRNSSVGTLDTMEPVVNDSISCNEAFKLLDGRVSMDQDKMDWITNLRPISPATRQRATLPPLHRYSALELDTASVIATLQHSMVPLAPRQSDGGYVDIVRVAQRRQRISCSPGIGTSVDTPS